MFGNLKIIFTVSLLMIMFTSSLQGETWQRIPDPDNLNMTTWVLEPNGTLWRWYKTSPRMYKSTDLGKTWSYKEATLDDGFVVGINQHIYHPEGVHFSFIQHSATGFRLYKSTDEGENWTSVNDTLGQSGLYISAQGDIYAVSRGGEDNLYYIYHSEDAGETFTLQSGMKTIFKLNLRPNGNIIVTGKDAEGAGGVFESEDKGETWNSISSSSKTQVIGSTDDCTGVGGINMEVEFTCTDEEFELVDLGTFGNTVRAITFTPDKMLIASVEHRGVYMDDGDGNYEVQNDGLGADTSQVTGLFYDAFGNLWASAQGNLYTYGEAEIAPVFPAADKKHLQPPTLMINRKFINQVITNHGTDLRGKALRQGVPLPDKF